MRFKFIALLLGTITAVSLAAPMQVRAAGFNLLEGVNLTPQQKAEIARITQQSEAELENMLTPKQQSLYQAYKQNPTNKSDRTAFWASFTPEQKATLRADAQAMRSTMNTFYTPEQQKQINHNLQVMVSELKAENKLPKTFYLGFWQPTARINPHQPLEVKIFNQTNIPLQYGLTTDSAKTILPGTIADINYVSLPADVLIYPYLQDTSLKYEVNTVGNTAFVTVLRITSGTPEDGSLAINRTGAIYVY
ncbi:Spy/CpxP family protein refolding chaperone [Nostoc sp. UHCC 0302]|uniref:Spy/CpxP family protein refolding chaperone n=1 Tax=Nostoc sp. UHCC 0302 TaxID=3134896 RepID=UPI00311C8FE8